MSEIVQWVIVAVAVLASALYLVKRIRPSKKGSNCAGCPYAGSCGTDKKNDCTR